MRIRFKIILLLLVVLGAIAVVGFYQKQFENEQLSGLFEQEAKEKELAFDRIVKLKEESLESFVLDYTYWDEMISFMSTKDLEWAKINIEQGLETFRANVVWAYQLDGTLVYSINNINADHLKEIPIPAGAIKSMFEKKRFVEFFVLTSKGLLKIRGATIHPSNDPSRKTPPGGYFFAGKLWNQEYSDELAKLIKGSVHFVYFGQKETIVDAPHTEKGVITFLRNLKDWDGRVMGELHVRITSSLVSKFNKLSQERLVILVLLLVGIHFTVTFFIISWVNIPLRSISNSLKGWNVEALGTLVKTKNEFGDIARLIKKFFEQHSSLLKEIKDRKGAEEALRKSEQRLEGVASSIPGGVYQFRIDSTGKWSFPYLNHESVRRVYGSDLAEALKNPDILLGIILPEDLEKIKKSTAESFQLLLPWEFEFKIRASDGSIKWIDAHSIPHREADGSTVWNGIFMDATVRKEALDKLKLAQFQLVQTEKMNSVGQLAAGVAHELNNPLMGVINFVQYCRTHTPESDRRYAILEDAEKEAEKCVEIIRNFLTFSYTPSEEEMVLEKEDCAAIFERVFRLLDYRIIKENVKAIKRYGQKLPLISTNANRLQQVFLNLTVNALDALKQAKRKELTVDIHSEDKFVRVDIIDTGCGMSETTVGKVFDPFSTTKPVGQGTGLGLWIAQSTIQKLGGWIECKSEVGRGTTFSIFLPVNFIGEVSSHE
jgi:signal transduction histidine kinase